ncbi:MAG: hypothetical protein ACYCQJ_12725 [Nitrososphaerales archaeon]
MYENKLDFLINDYFASLKSKDSKVVFLSSMSSFFGLKIDYGDRETREKLVKEELGQFLLLEDWRAEERISEWIQKQKGYYPAHNAIKSLRAVCEYCDYRLPWKRVQHKLALQPKLKHRAPTPQELQAIFDVGDTRFKFIVSAESSGGYRVGAYNYPFCLRDISAVDPSSFKEYHWEEILSHETKGLVGRLEIYRGEREEYPCLISDESLFWFVKYSEERKRFGEALSDNSPLVRNTINPLFPRIFPRALKKNSVMGLYRYAWEKAGYPAGTRKFKLTHCCRAFHMTQLKNAKMDTLFIKMLRGDTLESSEIRNASHYYLPENFRELTVEYAQKMHSLYISEAFRTRKENEVLKVETSDRLSRIEAKNIILEKELSDFRREYLEMKSS